MTDLGSEAAMHRVDLGLAEAEAAFAVPLPAVSDLRVKADRIAAGRVQIDAVFAARLDYPSIRGEARRVTQTVAVEARRVVAGHRRLRRRLYWQLVWVQSQNMFKAVFVLLALFGLVWAVWRWWPDIVAQVMPSPPAPPTAATTP